MTRTRSSRSLLGTDRSAAEMPTSPSYRKTKAASSRTSTARRSTGSSKMARSSAHCGTKRRGRIRNSRNRSISGARRRGSPSRSQNVLSRAETLDEFRFAARCVHDLTSAWQMIQNNHDITDIEWLSWTPDLWEDKYEPQDLLTAMLARFLRFFSPQLAYEMVHDQTEDTGRVRAQPKRGPSEKVPLYAICALELFNHIIEDAEYRICANERCERTFVHQEGRSQKGQRRSRGVIYCSPACARAKAQREYRKRTRRNAGD